MEFAPLPAIAVHQAVKKHVEFYLQHKTPFHEEDLQALMPPSLRQESVLQIHKVCLM